VNEQNWGYYFIAYVFAILLSIAIVMLLINIDNELKAIEHTLIGIQGNTTS
jgi:uncharacterized protein YoxC